MGPRDKPEDDGVKGRVMSPSTDQDQGRAALLSAFGCYVLWGFMPLLFMGQHAVGFDALEILAHRALWAAPVAALLVWMAKQGGQAPQQARAPGLRRGISPRPPCRWT